MIKLLRFGYLDNPDEPLREIVKQSIKKDFGIPGATLNPCSFIVQPTDYAFTYSLKDQGYDLAILNIGENIDNRFKTIRESKRIVPTLPVIIYTGRDLTEINQRIMDEGFQAVFAVQRPGETGKELTDMIRQVLHLEANAA